MGKENSTRQLPGVSFGCVGLRVPVPLFVTSGAHLLTHPPQSQLTRSDTGVLVSTASSLFVGRDKAVEDDTVSLRSCL